MYILSLEKVFFTKQVIQKLVLIRLKLTMLEKFHTIFIISDRYINFHYLPLKVKHLGTFKYLFESYHIKKM